VRFTSLVFSLFLFRVAAMASGTVAFNLQSYVTPSFPWVTEDFAVTTGIALADFNRDGIPDLAYTFPGCDASSSCAGVIVKLGTGGGSLGPDVFYTWGAQSLAELVAADFNSDGWLDIMVRDVNGTGLFLLQNNGNGTFQWVGSTQAPQPFMGSFTVGDFNHDGRIDLAQINCDRQNGGFPFGIASCALYISVGNGSGQFTQAQSVHLKYGAAYNLQSADVNGDGNLDLLYVRTTYDGTLNQYSGVGAVWWGRGDGTFPSATYLKPAITNSLDGLAIADFNNDGWLDVALLAGRPCGPVSCALATADTVWMYKNNGGTSFTLTSQTKFAQHAGAMVPADINGDLNQDLIYYNPFAMGIWPVLIGSGGFQYSLGLGNDTLGSEGTLPDNDRDTAATFRDMDGDSRVDYAVIDPNEALLGIGIQTGGLKNCPPPNSAKLAAKICGIKDGAIVTSPVMVRASGNSPAGVNQLQVWIDGKKRYVKWGDQLAKKFTLSSGKHRIAVAANDKLIGSTKTVINVNVP
jgi:FG-GAP-like repeat